MYIIYSLWFGKGLLKVMKINVSSIADIVPVDMVDNVIIAVGWITAIDKWVWLLSILLLQAFQSISLQLHCITQ